MALAGLPSAVSELLDDDVLTFLRRADQHVLGDVPLPIQLVGHRVWRTAGGAVIDLPVAAAGVAAARVRLGATVHAADLAPCPTSTGPGSSVPASSGAPRSGTSTSPSRTCAST